MRSLNTGTSPVIMTRAPHTLLAKVEERRRSLGLTRSAFFREALRVAVGDRCCMTPWTADPFHANACSCKPRKGGTA
jgi:hypothetical protein